MYNVRNPDKVENDYKSLVGRIILCKLYPTPSLQPWASRYTRGTPPTEDASRHQMQETEPHFSLAPKSMYLETPTPLSQGLDQALISTVSRSSSEVKRKYGFAGKKDFDIFGRNKLFAPRIKWEALKVIVENAKNSAKEYEVAFNGIKASIENKGDITQVGDLYRKFH